MAAGGHIRLGTINGSAATVFWIDTAVEDARLIVVDGHDIEPLKGSRFGLAMGQRLDIELDLPSPCAFPILALCKGAHRPDPCHARRCRAQAGFGQHRRRFGF